MRHRWIHEIGMEIFWMKKELIRRWRMDTPTGIMGIIAVTSGFVLLIFMVQGIAMVIRGAIPWVAGSKVSALYWSSLGYALKATLAFLVFCTSIIVFILLKIFYRR
ncbi:hypothetical protein [Desulfitobacterium metallireducens]|uniref:Uncharacterized protein n=1 Tax=Desulfitobacterium metallireducens DSM 15288 TaxID=871968 RepID=W0E971_9FIRM|nr:hypothetical protein [Desulfitobacterium metallireducens]AHF05754.1 hypothetical protein DESME_00505 [Desulfitobacterium metallireducens DSM 15288]